MTTPRIPEIGEYVRGIGTLVAVETKPPPPIPDPEKDYIFEEITAHCEIRVAGEVVKAFNNVWDFYGKATSVADAIKHAKVTAGQLKVGPASDVEVVAVKTVERKRKKPCVRSDNMYDKVYSNFIELSYGAHHGMPDPVHEVVWSSRNP